MAMQPYAATNYTTEDGRPDGGTVAGVGLTITWQRGAIQEPDGTRHEPNGAFVETVIDAARQRIAHYQDSPFACAENAAALVHLEAALEKLDERTKNREARGVEGTHEV